jgi:DNA-binding Xre family transcriptional regulator
MAINKALLGPQSESENEAYVVESLVFSVQIALQRAMSKCGMTNKALAERLGMSPARVSQIFSTNGPNLTLRTIGKIMNALGEEFEFVPKCEVEVVKTTQAFKPFTVISFAAPKITWCEVPANRSDQKLRAVA